MKIIFDTLFAIHSVAVCTRNCHLLDCFTMFSQYFFFFFCFVLFCLSSCRYILWRFCYLWCCKTYSHLWQRSNADIKSGSAQARCSTVDFLHHIPTISKLKPLFVVSFNQIQNVPSCCTMWFPPFVGCIAIWLWEKKSISLFNMHIAHADKKKLRKRTRKQN